VTTESWAFYSRFRRYLRPALRTAATPLFLTMKGVNWLVSRNTVDAPFHDPARFAWREQVQELCGPIQQEIRVLQEHMQHVPRVHDLVPKTGMHYPVSDWRHVTLKYNGLVIDDHCALFPSAAKILDLVPGISLLAISVLRPGEVVASHAHIYRGFLIFHLGLKIPAQNPDCALRVHGEARSWEEGRILVIDPTYEHDAWNRTDEDRIIVLCEFSRPDSGRFAKLIDVAYQRALVLTPVGQGMLREILVRAKALRAAVGRA
jgi:beta-hydroxylase